MYLMELIIKVVKVKRRDLIILILNTLVIILFYYLLFENSEVIYPMMLSGFVIAIYFGIEVMKYKNFEEKLHDSKKSPNYISSYASLREEKILNVISDIHKEYLNRIYTLNQEVSDKDALFSQWIHNMKTSITVIDLACERGVLDSGDNKYIRDIREENNTLKKNLEECLNVLRLDDFSRDYVTDSCNLKVLVNGIVNVRKRDFIYKNVFPKVAIDENVTVYTDKKWCAYMIEQIISNSIKYSSESKEIKISSMDKEDKIELFIEDYGVGISEEDLPRIFDPFFTGRNGRKDRSATGIGLYMVKIISKKLGHEVQIESKSGAGTKVKITFNKQSVI